MRKSVFIIACLFPAYIFSQTVNITPAVKSVTLYQSGALVTHEGNTTLEPGKTTVVFHGLPSNIDRQSIQLASTGDITILSVTTHFDYLSISKNNPQVRKWQDSAEILNEHIEYIKDKIEVLQDAKKLLDDNRTVGGTTTGTTVMAVKSMYEYYVQQANAIDDSLMHMNRTVNRYGNRLQKITWEIRAWRERTDTVSCNVEASVSCDTKQNLTFFLSYLTADARWSPVYDLRAQDTKHHCQFAYKANISQYTGQDWNNVDLTLSSANPVVSQTAPVLEPWYLSYQSYSPYKRANASMAYSAGVYNSQAMDSSRDLNIRGGRSKLTQYIVDGQKVTPDAAIANVTSVNQLSVEFHIDIPYSLPSDNKPHTVEIKNYDLNATYHYITIPKIQKNVFLLAGITHWEDLNILPGTVNVYYAGAYVGKSSISPENTSDTLNFSLGMDKRIVVTRTRIQDFSSAKWIGSNKTQTFGWTITLHNAQSDSVSTDVYDQIPLSTNKDIEITAIDLGGAKEDEQGKLTWHISLAAGETKKLTFTYSVKYPKDKSITNLWQ